jgi:GT2 family glycosyltransferase
VSRSPDVDVVIALHRPGAWIDACLASLRSQRDVALRTILVDDDPAAPMASALAETMTDGLAIPTTQNRGFAAATNAGISAGDAPYVLCLNQDASLAPDYVVRLVTLMRSTPELGSASGKILRVRSPVGPADGTLDSAGLEMRPGRRAVDLGQGAVDDGRFDGEREVFGVSAAAALYRRSALERVACEGAVFDDSFFMYKEDVDLAWRLRRAGYEARVDGDALAYHGRSAAGPPPGRGIGGLLAILTHEWAKPKHIRRLSWRNQLLLIVKNESPGSIDEAFGQLVRAQVLHACADVILDPIGGVMNRIRVLPQLPGALARRDGRYGVDVDRWLP